MEYDIVGDIHGHADKLEGLLSVLGYRKSGASWQRAHPNRSLVFVGDYVDRGPRQVDTVNIVQALVDDSVAHALMGNHELNAIAWYTSDPRNPGEFVRPHQREPWGPKNRQQHAAFLNEVERDPVLHQRIIEWFWQRPLWLELPEIRVVHACWHASFLDFLRPRVGEGNTLPRDELLAATTEPEDPNEKDSPAPSLFKTVEALLKGIEIPLPDGGSFADKDGHERRRVRVKWWDPGATTYRRAAMIPESDRNALPELPIPAYALQPYTDSKPVFFGHYWLTGKPAPLGPTAACVDYSAGKGGPLAAYRWRGEPVLKTEHLCSFA